jgi:DNA invertase Pin-like site-specific DNA recombinase
MFQIYVRVSEVGGRTGDSFGSPEEQEAQARVWAERNGVEVEAEPVIELDVSGKADASERELGRLVERCESGELEGIIFYDLDRFSRDRLSGGMTLRKLRECHARAIFVRQGIDYPSGSDLVINILLDVADDQWHRLRDGRERAKQRAVERGLHLSNRAPYGYRFADRQTGGRVRAAGGGIGRLEHDPKTGSKVTVAFERRAKGESFGKIADYLGVAGKSSAKAIINNRVYVGEVKVPGKDEPKTNAHPPLVSEDLWERANAVGPKRAPRDGRWSSLTRLNGLVRCSGCHKTLAAGGRGTKPGYACTNEGHNANEHGSRVGIDATELDEHVGYLVTQAVLDKVPEVVAVLEGDDRYQRALDAVEAARQELETYSVEIKVSDVGVQAWKRDVAARREALKLARQDLQSVPAVKQAYSTPLPVTPAQWEKASKERRRAIVEAAMDREHLARIVSRVVIKPSGRGRKLPAAERAEVYLIGMDEPYAA